MPTHEHVTQLAEQYVINRCKGYYDVLQELTKGVRPQDRAWIYSLFTVEVTKLLREQKEKK